MKHNALTRLDIVEGLRQLGVEPGDKLLVHSSLAALGDVDGGADTVIDALLQAVGSEGLVAVPTFGGPEPFDRRTTPTPLGIIADHFWRKAEALRSLHPTHSVAAIGKGAEELVRGHEKAPTGYAEGTPYYKLAMAGGKVLLLGVDQDRNTTLHAAEAIGGAPYLDEVTAVYVDDNGSEVRIGISAMAGPHRNFIGLDRMFRERGVTRIGKIGNAVCRLMDGRAMLETAINAIRTDPAAVLCDNPACADCVVQRARIKESLLAQEDFTLAAVAGDISDDPSEIITALRAEGIGAVELTTVEYVNCGADLEESGLKIAAIRAAAGDSKAAGLAARLKVPVVVPVGDLDEFQQAVAMVQEGACVYVENNGASCTEYSELLRTTSNAPKLAFNPAWFAAAGEKPFLQVFYKGTLRKQTAHFYIDDATFDGTPALPGRGNGEVKEIISMLRCRSYDGIMTLRSHKHGTQAFSEAAAAFWQLLDTI